MALIPLQKTQIFLQNEYYVAVEKATRKEYRYQLIFEDNVIDRFVSDKEPFSINKSSTHISSFVKKLTGHIEYDADGITVKLTSDNIRDKLMSSFADLQDLLDAYVTTKESKDAEQKQKEEEELKEHLYQKADDFINFLFEHNISLTTYLYYCAEWLNGGESDNTMKGLISHLSTYFGIKPVWFIALGKAGEGKTIIEESAEAMMPKEVFLNGRISESALHRKAISQGNDYVDRKIFKMGDLGGAIDIEKWSDTIDRYKELSTDGETEVEMVGEGIDQETGERNLLYFKLIGYPSVTLTSVHTEGFDDQILSRGISVTPQATDYQVKQFVKYNKGVIAEERDRVINEDISKFHNYARWINLEYADKVEVINPYWECLENWFNDSEYYKRNLGMYPSLVETVTLLNYPFRETIIANNKTYVISTREDNQLIADLFNVSKGLSLTTVDIFNRMTKWFVEDASVTDHHMNVQCAFDDYQEHGGNIKDSTVLFTASTLKGKASKFKKYRNLPYGEMINSMVSRGLVTVMGKMNRGNNNVYALEQIEPFDEGKIEFNIDCISAYVEEMSQVYRVPHTHIWECIDNEKSENDGEFLDCPLGLPLWSVENSSKYHKGITKYQDFDTEVPKRVS